MKNLFLLAAAFALAACAAPTGGQASPAAAEQLAAFGTLTGERPIIIAHRGASGLYPEHTALAYRTAIEQGADFIEPDLVMTKDGVLIARHDHYLSATTNIAEHPEFADRKRVLQTPLGDQEDWWADDFTLAELKTLKARQQFPTRSMEYNDQLDILTFDEVIDIALEAAANGRPVGLHVEAKAPGYFASVGLDMVDPILEALERKAPRKPKIRFSSNPSPPFLAALSAKSDLRPLRSVGEPYASVGLEYKLKTSPPPASARRNPTS